jgi:tetratricopeptide (TPR) repeat protein
VSTGVDYHGAVKRLIAGVTLLVLTVAGVYGYLLTRRERTFVSLVTRGEAALAAEDPAAAIDAFSGAIALKPDAMVGYLKRGEAYRRRHELDAALRDLVRASDLDPTATRPLEELGDVNVALDRHGAAAERYRAFVRIDDRVPRVLYKLAAAEYNAGQPAAAIEPLQKALVLDDRLAEADYLLGLCERALGKDEAARTALERAIALEPTLFRARDELADLYGALGRTDRRLDQLEALAALDPSAPRSVALGLAYARAGQADRAVVTLARATERYPDEASPYVALGRVWLEVAESRNDRVALSKAIGALEATRDRSDSESLTLLGRALLLARDIRSAEEVLENAAAHRPVDTAAFYYLADAAERLGHYDLARRALLDYRTLHEERESRRAAVRDARLGDLSLRLKDAQAAAMYYLQAAEAMGTDATYLARAADAQWRAGAQSEARATLARALDRDPANATALAVQRRIGRRGSN